MRFCMPVQCLDDGGLWRMARKIQSVSFLFLRVFGLFAVVALVGLLSGNAHRPLRMALAIIPLATWHKPSSSQAANGFGAWAIRAQYTSADVLRDVLRDGLAQITLPDSMPNATASPACQLPSVRRMQRIDWGYKDATEDTTHFFFRLLETRVVLYTSGQRIASAMRRPPITYSVSPVTAPTLDWTPGSRVAPEAPSFVAVFRNVWVRNGWVLDCKRAFTAGGCLHRLKGVSRAPWHFDKGFVLGDDWAKQYYHFTNEQLPRVALLYDHLLADPTIRILAPLRAFVLDYLVDVLGFDQSRILDHTASYHFTTAFYSTPMVCGNVLLRPLLLLRRIVFRRLNLSEVRTPELDGLSRKPLVLFPLRDDVRQPRNHDAIIGECRQRFPLVYFWEEHMERFSMRQQIAAFNRADIVVGAHGANLANIMWMPFNGTVLEYVPGRTANPCYYNLANRLGLDYRMVVLPVVQGKRHAVPVEEVVRNLGEALARLHGRASSVG